MKEPGPQQGLATFPILVHFLLGGLEQGFGGRLRRDLRGSSPHSLSPRHAAGRPHLPRDQDAQMQHRSAPEGTPRTPTSSAACGPGNLKSEAPTPAAPNHRLRRQALPPTPRAAAEAASGIISWSPAVFCVPSCSRATLLQVPEAGPG